MGGEFLTNRRPLLALADLGRFAGHRPMHHEQFARAFVGAGADVVLFNTCPAGLPAALFEELGPDRFAALRIADSEYSGPPQGLIASAVRSKACRQAISKTLQTFGAGTGKRIDAFFFLGIDDFLGSLVPGSAIDRAVGVPWGGLFFYPEWPSRHIIKRIRRLLRPVASPLLAANCRVVATLDESQLPRLERQVPGKRWLALPDFSPLETSGADPVFMRHVEEFAQNRKLVLIVGGMAPRKGLTTFLSMAAEWEDPRVCFAACGELQESWYSPHDLAHIRQIAESTKGRVFFHPHRLPSEDTLNALIARSDAIFASYLNFANSSNIMTKAAHFEKPVVVSEGRCMAARVRAHRLGLVIPEGSPGATREAFETLLFGSPLSEPDYRGYADLHRLDRLPGLCAEILSALTAPG